MCVYVHVYVCFCGVCVQTSVCVHVRERVFVRPRASVYVCLYARSQACLLVCEEAGIVYLLRIREIKLRHN